VVALVPAFVWAAVAAVLGADGFLAYVAHRLTSPPRHVGDWTPAAAGLAYEDVSFLTPDGLRLSGWWIDSGSDLTVVPLHGYSVSRWAFYIPPVIEEAARRGYNVLAFDFRAHGRSEGRRTTIGVRELDDLRAALDWLETRGVGGVDSVGLVGFSMGGVVAIRALAEDRRVACAVADSPPIHPDRTAARGLRYFAGLPEWIYPFVKPYALLLSRASPVHTLEYAERLRKPLMVVAGRRDPLVSVEEVREFVERARRVNPSVELWETEAEHVRTIKLDGEAYLSRVLGFIDENLGARSV